MSDQPDRRELALVAEAARKSAVCWISYTSDAEHVVDRLVWHCWHDDAVLLLSRPGEQHLPGLGTVGHATVALRSADNGGLLVRRTTRVHAIPVDSPEWSAYAAALLATRLNHGPAAETLARWREDATVLRLDPRPRIPAAGESADTLTS